MPLSGSCLSATFQRAEKSPRKCTRCFEAGTKKYIAPVKKIDELNLHITECEVEFSDPQPRRTSVRKIGERIHEEADLYRGRSDLGRQRAWMQSLSTHVAPDSYLCAASMCDGRTGSPESLPRPAERCPGCDGVATCDGIPRSGELAGHADIARANRYRRLRLAPS